MVLRGEAFGKCLGHEHGVLMNGTSVLAEEQWRDQKPRPPLCHGVGRSEKVPATTQEEGFRQKRRC